MTKNKDTAHPENPFGRWQEYRGRIAALSRADVRDPAAQIAEARQLLRAARLADAILAVRDELTDQQRATLAAQLVGWAVGPDGPKRLR